MNLLLAAFAVGVAAAESPKPLCALLEACGLAVPGSSCTAEQSKPVKGIVYDAMRCAEPRDLVARGVSPESGIGPSLYTFLGGRYRVVYDITGEAPVSAAKFDYLARELPLAAKLATRFSKTKYSIRYAEAPPARFFASRADKLTGQAELLFFDEAERRRTYYGWGSSKFGPWKLHGAAYLDIRIRPGSQQRGGIAYDVRIRTTPANATVNAIMGLGLFKRHVIGQIRDTMKDMVVAAEALAAQGLDALLDDPSFTPEEREKIRAFAALP